MNNHISGNIPLGLGMAIAQNSRALDQYALLSDGQKSAVLEGARNVTSKQEMQAFVSGIAEGRFN